MPIVEFNNSTATPHKNIEYITRPGKAACWETLNLIGEDRLGFADQIMATQHSYNKGYKENERKYYHSIISFSPEDDIDETTCQAIAMEWTKKYFKNHECVVATHNDRAHIHAHISISTVSFADGKKLHLPDKKIQRMKDHANKLAAEKGFSTVEWRKPAKEKKDEAAFYKNKEKYNVKEVLQKKIKEAISFTQQEGGDWNTFVCYLESLGVTLTRTSNNIGYLDESRQKAVRADKLGESFLKENILKEINKEEVEQEENPGDLFDDLKKSINIAKVTARSWHDFAAILAERGVLISKNTENSLSFKVQGRQQPIRDRRLGKGFSKAEILEQITKNSQCEDLPKTLRERIADQNRESFRETGETAYEKPKDNMWMGTKMLWLFRQTDKNEITGAIKDLSSATEKKIFHLTEEILGGLDEKRPLWKNWQDSLEESIERIAKESFCEDLNKEEIRLLALMEQQSFVFEQIVDMLFIMKQDLCNSDFAKYYSSEAEMEKLMADEEIARSYGDWFHCLLNLRFNRSKHNHLNGGRIFNDVFKHSMSHEVKMNYARRHQHGHSAF